MKRITIKDLAEYLNVSISTISRSLNDHPDISDGVKAKVKEAAKLFNYHPSDFAVNFRKGSRKIIALIVPSFSMFFIPSIIEGISAKLNKEGYRFFILSSEESYETEAEHLQMCANSGVDGVLISLSKDTQNLEHFKTVEDVGIPIVIFDKSIEQEKFDTVVFENKETAENCAQKMIDNGCKNILAVFGDQNLDITKTRKEGFQNMVNKHPSVQCKIIFAESAELAKEKVELLLDYENFDGIFAMSDEVLAGVNIALINKGIPITEIMVLAISEGILPKFLNSHYQFEKHDGLKMGIRASELLLDIIKKNKESQTEHQS